MYVSTPHIMTSTIPQTSRTSDLLLLMVSAPEQLPRVVTPALKNQQAACPDSCVSSHALVQHVAYLSFVCNNNNNNNVISASKPTCHLCYAYRALLWKWIVFTLGLPERKAGWCVVRADKSWTEAEWLTDSSCMQRWVVSAGFTLLAFACLQLA